MSIKNSIAFIFNFYLLVKILFGQNGAVAIYQYNQTLHQSQFLYQNLVRENYIGKMKSEMLDENKIDLRYLEELLRTKYSFAHDEERVIFRQ